jgi:hypothetical protein
MNPIHKKNLLEFIGNHFDRREERSSSSTGEEIRVYCPFCHGGPKQEFSFDINVSKGAVRCWRATCAYSASAGWFLKDFLDIPYHKAMEILEGEGVSSVDNLRLEAKHLESSLENKHRGFDLAALGETIDIWPNHCNDLDWRNGFEDVSEWIENRGYDPEEFMDQHRLYWPEQIGRMEGRVLFEVRTLMHRTYLAYAIYPEVQPKTLNPPGAVLSRMLYNYNSVLSSETVFVCEGIFDAARLISWGLSAVALFGVNISIDQVYLLSKLKAKEICVLLDNGADDKAVKVVQTLAEFISHKKISMATIEREGADPDELSEEEFLRYFKKRSFYLNNEKDILKQKVASLFKNV